MLFCVLYGEFLYRYITGRHVKKQFDLLAPFYRFMFWRKNKQGSIAESSSTDEEAKPETVTSEVQAVEYVPEVSSYRIFAMSIVLGFATELITVR